MSRDCIFDKIAALFYVFNPEVFRFGNGSACLNDNIFKRLFINGFTMDILKINDQVYIPLFANAKYNG